MRAPRIALFTNKMDAGGVQRAVVALAREFVARGVQVELLLARARGELLGQLPDGRRFTSLGHASPASRRAACTPRA